MWRDQPLRQDLGLDVFAASLLTRLQRTNGFEQRFLERPPDGHHFADRLHLWTQVLVGAGKLFKLPLRYLDDHVIERRLEAGRGLARDVVGDLVERVADGKLGGNLRYGETGCFAGQRRAARNARVHLDHDHASGGRLDRELDVAAAGLDADLAN